MSEVQPGEARAFLGSLFDGVPKRARVVLWTRSDKASRNFSQEADGEAWLDSAAGYALERRNDVYVHASLAARDVPKTKRINNATAAGIPGVWADIDVAGGPEDKPGKKAAPTLDAALEVAHALLEPTLIVSSGYGLHAWWLLDDGPWVFESTDERDRAQAVCFAWIRLVRAEAERRGFGIDATQDGARLMRVPETLNTKGKGAGWEARPCRGWPDPVTEQDGPRYTWEAIAELAERAPAAPASATANGNGVHGNGLVLKPGAQPPLDKLEALRENSDAFDRTWRHTRKENACSNWSMSEYDLSLVSQAVQAEWTDQELADLIIAHRRKHGDPDEKALRLDYVGRTIAKARAEARAGERVQERADALADLEQIIEAGGGDHDFTVSAFNKVVGGPAVKELVQDGRDPQTATFTLYMGNGEPVRLGGAASLLSPDRFAEALMVVTGFVMPKIAHDEWRPAVQALMTTRHVRESTDDTPEGTVVEWLRRYLFERLTPDHQDAARRREPFEKDGEVYVFGASFGQFVRNALRIRVTDPEVKDMLRQAGFERKQVGYPKVDEGGDWTTASYYAAPRGVVDA